MKLKNKICLITGSSKGIGAKIAKAYSNEGAKIIITYNKNKLLAENLAKKINCVGIYKLDVKNSTSVKNVFKKVYDKNKKIDVLVNNAGVNATALEGRSFRWIATN